MTAVVNPSEEGFFNTPLKGGVNFKSMRETQNRFQGLFPQPP